VGPFFPMRAFCRGEVPGMFTWEHPSALGQRINW
jgi:hypothetical protein